MEISVLSPFGHVDCVSGQLHGELKISNFLYKYDTFPIINPIPFMAKLWCFPLHLSCFMFTQHSAAWGPSLDAEMHWVMCVCWPSDASLPKDYVHTCIAHNCIWSPHMPRWFDPLRWTLAQMRPLNFLFATLFHTYRLWSYVEYISWGSAAHIDLLL